MSYNKATVLDIINMKRNSEAVKETLSTALNMLSEVKPLTHSEQVEQNSCQLFNTGRFNDIVLAYLIVSMRAAGTPQNKP